MRHLFFLILLMSFSAHSDELLIEPGSQESILSLKGLPDHMKNLEVHQASDLGIEEFFADIDGFSDLRFYAEGRGGRSTHQYKFQQFIHGLPTENYLKVFVHKKTFKVTNWAGVLRHELSYEKPELDYDAQVELVSNEIENGLRVREAKSSDYPRLRQPARYVVYPKYHRWDLYWRVGIELNAPKAECPATLRNTLNGMFQRMEDCQEYQWHEWYRVSADGKVQTEQAANHVDVAVEVMVCDGSARQSDFCSDSSNPTVIDANGNCQPGQSAEGSLMQRCELQRLVLRNQSYLLLPNLHDLKKLGGDKPPFLTIR
jgi:hypothetical protein